MDQPEPFQAKRDAAVMNRFIILCAIACGLLLWAFL
jgi:hypothetical protein